MSTLAESLAELRRLKDVSQEQETDIANQHRAELRIKLNNQFEEISSNLESHLERLLTKVKQGLNMRFEMRFEIMHSDLSRDEVRKLAGAQNLNARVSALGLKMRFEPHWTFPNSHSNLYITI